MEEPARLYVNPTESLHKRVMRYYKPFLKGEFVMLSILAGCLLLGFAMLFIVYSFGAKMPWAMGAAAVCNSDCGRGRIFVKYCFYSLFLHGQPGSSQKACQKEIRCC